VTQPAVEDAAAWRYPRDTRTRDLVACWASSTEHVIHAADIQAVLDEAFDQAIVHHGYVDYLRDYEIIVYCTADPGTGVKPEHVRLLFTHCVAADVATAVPTEIWLRSMDDRLLDAGIDHADGYVWAIRWQGMYPGGRVLSGSERAEQWTQALGRQFHEVRIETNGHHINPVFAELKSSIVSPGYVPFVVGDT
jgi:hypothetical protein